LVLPLPFLSLLLLLVLLQLAVLRQGLVVPAVLRLLLRQELAVLPQIHSEHI
jgi:hypothetical protein